jgi:hypothetical protein
VKGLTNDINTFFKSNNLNDVQKFIDKLFIDVLDSYNLKTASESGTPKVKPVHKPYIALSESLE